jgi:transcriptional regulator with XRE-family HTH domain
LRTIKDWSLEQVADKLDMSAAGYGGIERGETDICITRLAQIAEIFEVGLPELLEINGKTVYNFTQAHNQECNNWQLSSPTPEMKELMLKTELEKCQLLKQAQATEIENLKEQIGQLREIIGLLKKDA